MKKQYVFTDAEYNFIKSSIEQCNVTVYKQLNNCNDNSPINIDMINLGNDLQLVLGVLEGYLDLEE